MPKSFDPPFPWVGAVLSGLIAAILPIGAVDAEILLNEVLYDPVGPDSGCEFVELFNTASRIVCLEGVALDFANGAVGEVWERRWTGTATDSLPGYGFFLIVDRGWAGAMAPDAEVKLALQNGPDALRLLRSDGSCDVLGYGALAHPGLYESWPHPGAGTGWALARYPDGRDTQCNKQDWREKETPTPGAPNYQALELQLIERGAEPPCLAAPGCVVFHFRIRNAGLETVGPTQARLLVDGNVDGEPVPVAAISAGAEADLFFECCFSDAGRPVLEISIPMSVAGDQICCLAAGDFQVEWPELILSEVMATPESAGCEWVELLACGMMPVILADYEIADADGAAHALPEYSLDPGARLLIVQDRPKFLDWLLRLEEARDPLACLGVDIDAVIETGSGWPTLNNSPPDSRDYADRLSLLEAASGLVIDDVIIGHAGLELPSGRSLERVHLEAFPGSSDLNWGVSTAQAGSTPGCPNSLSPSGSPSGGLQAEPNPFCAVAAGGTGIAFSFQLSDPESGWLLEIFEPWGRRLRVLKGDLLGAGPRAVHWDGTLDDGGVPGHGALIAVLSVSGPGGGVLRREKRLIAGLKGAACR